MDTIKAAIFDLDGTLVDSMWVWEKIDIEFLGKRGHAVPENLKDSITHLSFKQVAEYFKTTFSIEIFTSSILELYNMFIFFNKSLLYFNEDIRLSVCCVLL